MILCTIPDHRRTSKSRRKADRKKLSLREGSTYEGEALVEALKDIVSTVDSMQDDVGHLLPSLVQFGFTKEAATVQKVFAELLELVRANMGVVWPSGEDAPVGLADVQVCGGCGQRYCDVMMHCMIIAEEFGTWCHCE